MSVLINWLLLISFILISWKLLKKLLICSGAPKTAHISVWIFVQGPLFLYVSRHFQATKKSFIAKHLVTWTKKSSIGDQRKSWKRKLRLKRWSSFASTQTASSFPNVLMELKEESLDLHLQYICVLGDFAQNIFGRPFITITTSEKT